VAEDRPRHGAPGAGRDEEGPRPGREAPEPRAAVTGAGGFFGRALEPKLAARARLRGLFRERDERADAWEERGHDVVLGDLHDDRALASLVHGAEVVYHLAARKAKDDPEASRRVNVEGSERLARAAGAAGVDRLVYVSSISVYAATETPGGVVTEEVEPRGIDLLNPYSATKYGGELAVRRVAEAGEGPAFTIVRPTNVYGPWGRSWFLDWVDRLRRLPVVIGGRIPVDVVHVDDVAEALIRAGASPAAAGEVLHIGHHEITLADFVARIGDVIGKRVWRLPSALDYAARFVIEKGHRLLKGNRMSSPLTRVVRYPHEKARRLIGYQPRISLDEGFERLERWYRKVWLPRQNA